MCLYKNSQYFNCHNKSNYETENRNSVLFFLSRKFRQRSPVRKTKRDKTFSSYISFIQVINFAFPACSIPFTIICGNLRIFSQKSCLLWSMGKKSPVFSFSLLLSALFFKFFSLFFKKFLKGISSLKKNKKKTAKPFQTTGLGLISWISR